MNTERFLSIPANRSAAEVLSQQVLAEIAPDEVELSAQFVGPIIDDIEVGKETASGDIFSDEPGGFGSPELMVMVVVPIVVGVVSQLLIKLGEIGIEELKGRLKKEKNPKVLLEVSLDDIKVVISKTRYAGDKKKIARLHQAVNKALLDYLK